MSKEHKERRDRFRRPEIRPAEPRDAAGAAGEVAGPPAAAAPAELSMALKPLQDLARAFQENTETLRSIAEGQERLARRVDRSDRAEAIVTSTSALNETFRGVQRTQERLLGKLATERRRPWFLLVAVLLLAGGLAGGAIWYLTSWADRRERTSRADHAETLQGLLAGERDRSADLADEIAAHRDRVAELGAAAARLEREAAEARTAAEERDRRIAYLEEVNANLRANQGSLGELTRENAALASENARFEVRIRELEDELREVEADLAERESAIADLRRRIAGLPAAAGPPAEAPAASSPDREPGPASPDRPAAGAAVAEPVVPPEAARDPAELGRVVSVLNGLLLDSRGAESYRILKIGGIRGRILYDVAMVHLDAAGNEAKRIEGAEARIVVDETQRRAEIRFRHGHLVYYGVKAPFWGGSYVVPLPNIDPEAWLRSGLTILELVK